MRGRRIRTPSSISAEAKSFFENATPLEPMRIAPDTMDAVRQVEREAFASDCEAAREFFADRVEEIELGGVAVQVVVPKGYDTKNDSRAVLYFFGGAFVVGGPFEDLPITAPLAHRLGCKVYAPHYRLAPESPFPAARDDVLAVYGVLHEMLGPENLAVVGESAGGNLALTVTLCARDAGLGMPAALALLSPWCDISRTGDSQWTLAGLDPTLDYDLHLKDAAAAYAGDHDLKDPFVSPIYRGYGRDFPPTLITTGTRDLFLSDCARLSAGMRRTGIEATLHVWEGMWHVFEWYPDLPEARQSLDEIAAFLEVHLTHG